MDSEPADRETVDVCCGCSLFCDDIRFEQLKDCCPRGDRWWQTASGIRQAGICYLQGKKIPRETLVETVASWLVSSRRTVFAGLENLDNLSVQSLVQLARRIGAVIASPLSLGESILTSEFQRSGLSTCTLGQLEIAARSGNLVSVFLNCDQQEIPPRLLERFLSMSLANWSVGADDRRLSGLQLLPVPLPGQMALLQQYIDALKSGPLPAESLGSSRQWQAFHGDLLQADAVVFFVGSRSCGELGGEVLIGQCTQLIRLLNRHMPAWLLSLSDDSINSHGASDVLTYMLGIGSGGIIPRNVVEGIGDRRRGYEMLTCGDFDTAILVDTGSGNLVETIRNRPDTARQKTLVLSVSNEALLKVADAVVFTGAAGYHYGGDFDRIDNVVVSTIARGTPEFCPAWLFDAILREIARQQ